MGRLNILSQIYNMSQELVIQKATQLNKWYTRIIGLDEVREYHERVVTLQDKLLHVQEKRRETGWLLTVVRKKSNELQDQLHKVKRQDDLQRFLDLMREEAEAIKTEHEIQGKFNRYDLEEREVFTAFTSAIRDSHEKQRAQLEYTKYLGIILGIVGSFLAFCYSKFGKQDWNSIALKLQRNQYEIAELVQNNQINQNKTVHLLNDIKKLVNTNTNPNPIAQNNQINQNKIVDLLNDNKKLMNTNTNQIAQNNEINRMIVDLLNDIKKLIYTNTKPNPMTVYVPAVSNNELAISNKQFEVMATFGCAIGAFFLMLCCCCR